jgi:acetylornithine deacetylase/succinyl-diaminopimelate desuccinylase-like protein
MSRRSTDGGFDTVQFLRELIRFDTSNPPGREAACIAHVERTLAGAGLQTRLVARDPGRPNLIARLPGTGEAPPLLLHGHVDVVPAHDGDWRHPPFAGRLADGAVWGRGSLDMKSGIAMFVAVALDVAAREAPLPGDLLLAILADEEIGGRYGAGFLVEEHPELFGGVRDALGEGGGYVLEVAGRRFYPVKIAEKQHVGIRATARGPSGHGSLPVTRGAMGIAGRMLDALDGSLLPVHVTPVARDMLDTVARHTGLAVDLSDPGTIDTAIDRFGATAPFFHAVVRNTANPTMLRGASALNVVPGEVAVDLDGRVLPGFKPAHLLAELQAVVGPEVELGVERVEPGCARIPDPNLLDCIFDVIREADPAGVPMAMLDVGVSDARLFAELGIQTYGFVPMPTPPGFERTRLVHGVDEHIPVRTLLDGTEMLRRAVLAIFGARRSLAEVPVRAST